MNITAFISAMSPKEQAEAFRELQKKLEPKKELSVRMTQEQARIIVRTTMRKV